MMINDVIHACDVSVITATQLRADRRKYLRAVYRDIRRFRCSWEWILGVDGPADARVLPAEVRSDPRVLVLYAGRAVGAAAARNLALGHAHGRWITTVDDDDRLPPRSVDVRIRIGERSADRVWVAGMLVNWQGTDFSLWHCPAPFGKCAPGDVWRSWAAPEATFPLPPSTLLVRSDFLRAAGGWQGVPQAEDFGMAMAVTSCWPGFMTRDVVYTYRKHPGQTMQRPWFDQLESACRRITFERGRLLSAGIGAGLSTAVTQGVA